MTAKNQRDGIFQSAAHRATDQFAHGDKDGIVKNSSVSIG
jgi:hypothetical protein